MASRPAQGFSKPHESFGAPQLVVDCVVHLLKANGAPKPKVFKLKRITLQAHIVCEHDHAQTLPRPLPHRSPRERRALGASQVRA